MKKIIYFLLYVAPALVFGGISLYFLRQYISEFGYDISSPYMGFRYTILQIMVPITFILLSCLYLFYAFKQDNINKYTNWSVMSWYIGIIAFYVIGFFSETADAESNAFGAMAIAAIVLVGVGFSIISAHVVGFIRNIKPKFLNLAFIVFAILIFVNFLSVFIDKMDFLKK